MTPTLLTSDRWRQLAFVTAITALGSFVYAAAVNLFFIPHHFISGGATGLAMIFYYLTGFPIGVANLLLNVPILFLSWKYMGRFYTAVTVIGTVLFSLFIDVTAFMTALDPVQNPIIASICGGVLSGAGMGLIYRHNSSTGGLDVIGAIVKKYYNLEIGYVVFALNFIIIMASAVVFSLELAVCTLLAMYIGANVSNRIVIGFAQRKAAFIVSDRPLEISDALLRNIRHGATLLYGQGAFSGREKKIVFAIVDLRQIAKLRRLIEGIDPHAFLFIMNTTDVIGRGFTSGITPPSPDMSARYTIDADGKMQPSRMWEYEINSESHHYRPTSSKPKSNDK